MSFILDNSNRRTIGIGIALSLAWLIVFALLVGGQLGAAQSPGELGGLLAGLITPIGLLWLFLAVSKRGNDVARHTAALQAELAKLAAPLSEVEEKTPRMADALRRQVELLNEASSQAQDRLEGVGAALEDQAGQITGLAQHVAEQIDAAKQSLAGETAAFDDRI